MPLYFAYGSNMDRAAMRARCPGSRPLGPARLPRHRLAVMPAGYLSIVRDPRRTVWGLLWDLALADVPALDRYEGIAEGLYRKAQQPVLTDAGPRRALVYLGRGEGGVPRPGYLEDVIAAARAVLSPGAVGEIEALLPARAGPRLGGAEAGLPRVRPTRSSPLDPPLAAGVRRLRS